MPPPPGCGASGRIQPQGRQQRPGLAVHGPGPPRDHPGGGGGHRRDAGLQRQLPGERRGLPVRRDPAADGHRRRRFQLGAAARGGLPGPGGRAGVLRRGHRRHEPGLPQAVGEPPAAQALDAQGAAGAAEQLGGRLFRLRRGQAAGHREGRRRRGGGAVRDGRRLVRPPRRRHHLPGRLERGSPQAARRPGGPGGGRAGAGHAVRHLDGAGDGLAGFRPVSRPSRLVPAHPGPRGHHVPATSWCWTWAAGRSRTSWWTPFPGR